MAAPLAAQAHDFRPGAYLTLSSGKANLFRQKGLGEGWIKRSSLWGGKGTHGDSDGWKNRGSNWGVQGGLRLL